MSTMSDNHRHGRYREVVSDGQGRYQMNKSTNLHYLVGHYTTHQPDGVHLSSHCTCGEKLEGVGQDESAAMSAVGLYF
jgi:hypothetical protein